LDTGDLPPSTVISFHTGSVRRHAQLQQNKAINLSYASGSAPIRVDLMSQVGSHTFKMAPDQDVYDVPITSGSEEVKLKFRIRDASSAKVKEEQKPNEDGASKELGSPSRKLQTALMMRSYLDNHDVLRQMQELLQDMVTHRPEDPIDYMIQRLEEVSQDTQGAARIHQVVAADDFTCPIVKDEPSPAADAGQQGAAVAAPAATAEPAPTAVPATKTFTEAASSSTAKAANNTAEESEEDDDDAAEDLPPPPPPEAVARKRASVSAEAYGAFNQRKAYEKKVVPKSDAEKARVKEVLQQCWMFKSHTDENMSVIVDAMVEKVAVTGEKLVQQGDSGDVMWVIEQGSLECYKNIGGEEKLVKTCYSNDVFGELALMYQCPRAASVFAKEPCKLWELDRDTFSAICYEAAKAAGVEYEGFSAPTPPEKPKEQEANEPRKPTRRREGVSAEAMQDAGDNWTPPINPKSPEERQHLANIIKSSRDSKLHMLFGNVSKDTFEKIIDAMFLKTVEQGENAIEQGAVGDFFYIVKSGHFDIYVRKGSDPPKKVFEAEPGFAFGELALLYNAPRTATITANQVSEVWCLERLAFQNLVVRSSKMQFKQYVEFLNGVDIFQVLSSDEKAALAEVLEEEEFEDDEAILEQGEKDEKMFIVREGKAVACIMGDQGEVEVMQYSTGDYFGEIALLLGEPRKASVYAVGPCKCLYITRDTFIRILGPLHNLLERNLGKYAKYQDAMAKAQECDPREASTQNDDADADEEAPEAKNGGKGKVVSRKRNRQVAEVAIEAKSVQKEAPSEAEPATLAERVAQDFEKKQLVSPCDDFNLHESQIMVYGGLLLGQKFMDNKAVHCTGKVTLTSKDAEKICYWNGQTRLRKLTDIAVICQKGQKSAADPTPNQDNYFVHHVGSVAMYGVCDGHGPFGHLVSFRLVQTLPYYLTHNANFGKDWALALKEAFLAAQEDLEKFTAEHNINIEASGAAGSVVVLEEQTVHVAFIGDARVMLGSWNRRDSRLIFCSRDHKPNLPEEKARLEAAGSEVREIDPDNRRIYLPGQNFPGLTMSRAFGDTACKGVSREPEYHKFLMQPTDEWYVICASDGIWEFIDGEEACKMTAKKLRLKGPRETLSFLTNASRKRWAHCCGDYCDDITGIMVQWNSNDKKDEGGDYNHSFTVKKEGEN